MSLILQALKKAESERGLGQVPTLASEALADALPPRRRSALALGVLAAVLVGGGLVAVGWGLGQGPRDARAPAARVPTPTDRVAAAAPVLAPAPMPAAASMPAAMSTPPAPPPALATAVPAPAAASRAASATAQARALAVAPKPSPSRAATAPAQPPPSSAPLPTPDQLPPELQRVLPNLAVTGSIWSPSPQDRMLMIGGQVLHEGDRAGADVELVSIGQREAVLRVRGTAFRVRY